MSSAMLASRRFDQADQTLFAQLSGDFNPIHLDPAAARRTQAGAVVVHGVHAVLWALDKLVQLGLVQDPIASVRIQFTKFIYVGNTVQLRLQQRDEKSIRAELALGEMTVTTLIVSLGVPQESNGTVLSASPTLASVKPATFVHLRELAGLSGWMDVAAYVKPVEANFPYVARAIGGQRTTALARLSALVGMTCPGLHSLFASIAVELVHCPHDQDRIGFRVSDTDERFQLVRLAVSGAGIHGSLQSFLRRPPVAPASLPEISKIVAPTEFLGTKALIIGGSRGLGALTAKIIAAGGGRVIVTYVHGREEAQQLVEEARIQLSKEVCTAIQYDVRVGAAGQLASLHANVTHLYYFATTPIFRQKEESFVASLLDEFMQIYVKGFHDCYRFVGARGSTALTVFYPSSIAVETCPPALIEYCIAKLAGELLCANMNRANSRVHVVVNRLPRLLTDQTATVTPTAHGDSLEVLLPIIRNVQSFRMGS